MPIKRKGRRCCISTSKNMRFTGTCRNVATHKVYNSGCDPFLVCRTHFQDFKHYRTKPIKRTPLKRYPKDVVIAHARKQNTKAAARRLAQVDSGPYKVSR